jgi:hypothetical protein
MSDEERPQPDDEVWARFTRDLLTERFGPVERRATRNRPGTGSARAPAREDPTPSLAR